MFVPDFLFAVGPVESKSSDDYVSTFYKILAILKLTWWH